MLKQLVIAEKPSVGKELARVLGCRQAKNGYMTGGQYIVTWSFGHLVTLADPEVYGEQYKKWSLDTLPMLPEKMKLTVIKNTAKQFKIVKELLRSDEVGEVVIATDAGREGELVARWIIEKAACKKPIQRLWISSQTDAAIRDGFSHLKPGAEYENLYQSAKCRAEADWLVGLNVTRALTCKHNAQLSAGRVQTPTLAMIVERENEIKRFVPSPFETMSAKAGGVVFSWKEKQSGSGRSFEIGVLENLRKKISGKPLCVNTVKKQEKQIPVPLLYDLTELQRDANKQYGYSAKKTLNLMQQLYETHKLLTYPRTDSRYLSHDIVPTLAQRLKAVAGVFPMAKELLKMPLNLGKRVVDDTKVSDHHAIIPTEQYLDMSALSAEEKHIYFLVVKRFLASLSTPYQYEQTTLEGEIGGERFTARGKVVTSKGWKMAYEGMDFEPDEDGGDENGEEDRDQTLPKVRQGDMLNVSGIEIKQGKTTPPSRYTEGTLLTAMEFAGKTVTDKTMREAINTTGGLGTPATRADIIEKLFAVNYIELHGKEIVPTSKGIQLISIVPSELRSAELTGTWEQKLTAISKGQAKPKEFISEMRQYAETLVRNVVAGDAVYHHDNQTRNRCPECGEFLLEVNGKHGKQYVCKNRECGYRQTVSRQSNARCPQCHKKLEVRSSGTKKLYACKCGFRENFESFNRKLAEHSSKLSKREVSGFLNRQNKKEQEPFNSALADALAKLKQ